MKKKGFTLIELIVVMVIISILVLLGVPKYKEYTNQARITKLTVEAKELEKASQKYYISKGDWPRLTNIAYSKEEIEAFTEKIYDSTGKVIELEDNGNYYDINYAKLNNYISKPSNPESYILQNPVGNVYSLQGLKTEGKNRIIENDSSEPTEEVGEEVPVEVEPIIFSGLGVGAFDKVSTTSEVVSGSTSITWVGELSNKVLNITMRGGGQYRSSSFKLYFRDSNNKVLNFLNLSDSIYVTELKVTRDITKNFKVVVPEGAVKITFGFETAGAGSIVDIYTDDDLISPSAVKDITHTSTDSSITLNWNQNQSDYERVAIFRDSVFIGFSNGHTFTDKPLHSAQEYTYEIQALDNIGNASKRVVYNASTNTPEIVFRGIGAGAFDKDATTSEVANSSQIITWTGNLTNRVLNIKMKGSGTYTTSSFKLYFKDSTNQILGFIDLSNNTYKSELKVTRDITKDFKVVVPEGAVKIMFGFETEGAGSIIDIYSDNILTNPLEVKNITHTSTDSSITLNWEQTDINYGKVAIFRDGVLIGFSSGFNFIDKPLHSAQEYTYEIQTLDTMGNGSKRVIYKASTNTPEIIFRGMAAGAFDKSSTTSVVVASNTSITWMGDLNGDVLNIRMKGTGQYQTSSMVLYFKDINNNTLNFIDLSTNTSVSNLTVLRDVTKDFRVIVPDGAIKIIFGFEVSGAGEIIDIYVE